MIEKVNIKSGKKGKWSVDKISLTQEMCDIANSNVRFNADVLGLGDRSVIPGEYTRLMIDGKCMMSDTPAEMIDHIEFVEKAYGRVLIGGLGLGMVANAVAKKESVTEVVVVELEQDVIDLVSDSLNPKIKIIKDDLFDFTTNEKFDFGWFDIWIDISDENLKEFEIIRKRLELNVNDIGFWCEDQCIKMKSLCILQSNYSKYVSVVGYLHENNTIQAKRYSGPLDILEAEESPFVSRVYGPFVCKIQRRGIKNTIR